MRGYLTLPKQKICVSGFLVTRGFMSASIPSDGGQRSIIITEEGTMDDERREQKGVDDRR